jgi:hypothetical protein
MPPPDADLRGYTLVDADGRPLGPVAGFWMDAWTARPAFVSVLLGRSRLARVVPLERARLDEERRLVQVPYAAATVRDALACAPERALAPEEERQVLEHYRSAGGGAGPGSLDAIPLHEERVELGKRVVPAGGVRLRKVVRTKIINQPVEVRYEEIILERVMPEDAPRHAEGAIPTEPFREGALFLPEFREEPTIARRTAEVVGGVRARTETETTRETVPVDLRREDVEVDRLPRTDE